MAAARNDNAVSAGHVLPQLRLKRPTPARGVLSPPRGTPQPELVSRLTRLSDAAAESPFTRLVETLLYLWTVVAIVLGVILAGLVLYLMHFKDGGNLAPTLPFKLAAYGGLAITLASCLGLYGRLQHQKLVTQGRRNYALGMFLLLGTAGAVVTLAAGAMALSLASVVELAQDEDFASDRVVVLETAFISRLREQVAKSSSSWQDTQNELKCCGYDQLSAVQAHLGASSSSLRTAVEDVNAVGGRYCSTRVAECVRMVSEEHCPVPGRSYCRVELLQVARDNYSLLSTCAITLGAVQLLFSALGLFTLLCDVRRMQGSSPTYEMQHRMLSPIQPSAPSAD